MRKTAASGQDDERPVGEIVQQLVDEGKAYARAEVALVKAMAAGKAKAAGMVAALFGGAFLLAQAAVVMLAFGIFSMTYWYIGPVLAALLAAIVCGGGAWLLVRAAMKRMEGLK